MKCHLRLLYTAFTSVHSQTSASASERWTYSVSPDKSLKERTRSREKSSRLCHIPGPEPAEFSTHSLPPELPVALLGVSHSKGGHPVSQAPCKASLKEPSAATACSEARTESQTRRAAGHTHSRLLYNRAEHPGPLHCPGGRHPLTASQSSL